MIELCSDVSGLGWATSSIGGIGAFESSKGGFFENSVTIVILTAWYIGRVITDKGEFVEYGTISTARELGVDTIITDVEGTAILWVDVELVVTVGNSSLGLAQILVAGEPISKNLKFSLASLTESFDCPITDTKELIKVESVMAFAEGGDAIDAFVVFNTVGWVLMFETAVLAGAFNTSWLGNLLNFSFWAVYLEWVVALLNTGSESVIEDEAVRAELLGVLASSAFVVFVALGRVDIESILDTVELGIGPSCQGKE